jgi:glycolate oxidase FAD binding subunit
VDAGVKSDSHAFPSALREKLIAAVGPEHFRAAAPAEQVSGVQPNFVIEPSTESQLAELLRLSNEAGLAVIPRGGGTKLAWGNPPASADLILSTTRLNKIIEHAWADLTVSVEAGCTIQKLQQTLAQHGQRLALDPLWPEKSTVGGILSTNDSGALRLRFGALRDLIIGVTIALPDGTLASSGGKVVKNVAGYDLPKLVTGAFGTLGVITRAVFRLHPLPRNTRTFSVSTADPEATQRLILAIQDSKLAHTALQSHFCSEAPPTSDILFEGTEAVLAAQESLLRKLAGTTHITVLSGRVAPVYAEPRRASPAALSGAEPPHAVWNARQELWSFPNPAETAIASTAIAKFSILPASMARTIELVSRAADKNQLGWKALMYATGLAWLRLEGQPASLRVALQSLREELERREGSVVVLHRPENMSHFDTWGTPGDALPLMQSVKHRLDPANTLNPARFLAGV